VDLRGSEALEIDGTGSHQSGMSAGGNINPPRRAGRSEGTRQLHARARDQGDREGGCIDRSGLGSGNGLSEALEDIAVVSTMMAGQSAAPSVEIDVPLGSRGLQTIQL